MLTVEDAGTTLKTFAGTCVTCFDEDGECLVPALGWSHVSDFAVAEEDGRTLNETDLMAAVSFPAGVAVLVAGHELGYRRTENGVVMVHDQDDDIHYFFA